MKPPVFPIGLREQILGCDRDFSCVEQLIATSTEACKDINDCRTLTGIIWSCIATLIACTWVSVHPNVPNLHHGHVSLALHRFKLMLLAIIAPEMIVLWALRQRMVARKLRREHGMHIVHGFFVSMGGFVQSQGHTVRPIASHDIGHSVSASTIYNIDVKEIEDHSKGDEISKGLALLQTSWFILQCIARGRQHLPLTELEIVTLAFAALNIVIRAIWWEKPLDVRYPITITTTDTPATLNKKEEPKLGIVAEPYPEQNVTATPEPNVTPKLELPTAQSPKPVVKVLVSGPKERPKLFRRWLKALERACDDCVDVVLMMFEGDEENARIRRSATRVPTLWAGRLDGWQRGTAATIGIALAMGFGAIHFAAWNASFLTEPERVLWRVASILIVAVPFLFFLGAAVVLKKGRLNKPYHAIVFSGILPLGVSTYIVARVILMVLPFVSLRSLPPETLMDVEWVDFIPHIG